MHVAFNHILRSKGRNQRLWNIATDSVINSDGGLNVTTNIADHKVIFENNKYTVTEILYVVQIGDTKYETIADALAAAQAGDVITLVDNTSESVVMLNKGVTLDLNGYTLEADYVVAFKGNYIIDSTGTALLKVAKNNVVLHDVTLEATRTGIFNSYSQMPIYTTEGGYIFRTTKFQYRHSVDSDNKFVIDLRPTTANSMSDILANAEVSGLTFIIRLSWVNASGDTITQDFAFSTERVISAYEKNKTLQVIIAGLVETTKDVTVTAILSSDTGVVISETVTVVEANTATETPQE